MTNRLTPLVLLLLGFLLTTGVEAKTKYVTDQFKINMRSGESSSHRIKRLLATGSPVTVLSTDKKTGYSHVRTGTGHEGYVLTRQLLNDPVARDQLAAMKTRVDELSAAPGQLSARLAELQKEHANLQRAHQELEGIKKEIEQELSGLQRTSANAVRISNERNDLRKRVATSTREIEELKQDKRELENNTAQRWFMIGGGVLLGGILLGLILPHLRLRKRSSSWDSL